MARITEVVLGAGLLLTASVAIAGPALPGNAATVTHYPECEDAAYRTPKGVSDPGRHASVQDINKDSVSNARNRTIDEYLSFHARATEDNGKFTLMPWSGLRTHAN
jgi:hypothetical protein